jgi:hypothetical protein
LNGLVLKIGQKDPNILVADAESGFAAVFELANPEISVEEGRDISFNEVGIRWDHVLESWSRKRLRRPMDEF